MKNDNPVFVVGVGRSGTTLLRIILHNHPEIAIPYESSFIGKYYNLLQEYGDLAAKNNVENLLQHIFSEPNMLLWDHQFDIQSLSEKLIGCAYGEIVRSIYEEYSSSKNKRRWGDKSDTLQEMHIINRLFPDCQFIHIIRDGRDVAASVLKQKWGPGNIVDAAQWWRDNVNLGRKMGAMLPEGRYLEVLYEDLVSRPEEQARRICKYLNVDFSEQMLLYYQNLGHSVPKERLHIHYNLNKPPDPTRIFSWKRNMKKSDVAIFEKYCDKLLLELGYPVGGSGASTLSVNLHIGMVYIKKLLYAIFS